MMAAGLGLAGLTAGLGGCANPGTPKPPTLNLPQLPENVTAERVGDQVRVSWTTPSETTDKLKIKGPVTAAICLEGSGKKAVCQAVDRRVVAVGPAEALVTVPGSLTAGRVTAVGLRVELENDKGRSAGRSNAVLVAGGAAPAMVEGLTVTGTRAGALVRWSKSQDGSEVELQRVLVEAAPKPVRAAPGKAAAKPEPAKQRGAKADGTAAVTLKAGDGPGDFGGMLDTGVERLASYRYTAQRVRHVTVAGDDLVERGPMSAGVEFAYRDTFAPDAPTGLVAVAAETSIDLSWEASGASDIAGYNVYRRYADGSVKKLTAEIVVAAAFRDRTAVAGRSYTYWVTAVDANGNESNRSGEVVERLP